MLLGYIIHNAIISVDQIGVVPWSLFLWMVWLILHTVYKKVFQMLLQKIKVNESDQERLIKIYWTLVFTAITVPFALQNLSLTVQDIREKLKLILENNLFSWYNNNNILSIQTKLSYVLLTGYYLNNVCEISIESGFRNVDFFHSEFLTIFFASTFPCRCVLYGIALTSLINFVRFFLELSKFLLCIGSIADSRFLRRLAFVIFILHSFIWCVVFLHILPKYFLFTTFKKLKQKTDLNDLGVFSLLNFSLWSFYAMEIYKSPISCLITNYMNGKVNNVEDILFPSSNKQNEEELDITDFDLIESYSKNISPNNTAANINENLQTQQNLLALYQTVKCVIRVKRKLRKIREKLKVNQAENVLRED